MLKDWIGGGQFLITAPVQSLPGVDAGIKMNTLEERTEQEL
jgi:hypothetical protein